MIEIVATSIITPIQTAMQGFIQNACTWAAILGVSFLTIYILMYGAQLMLGVAKETGAEFLIRVTKTSFIFLLATSPVFYNEWLVSFTQTAGANIAKQITSNPSSDPSTTIYQSLDKIQLSALMVFYRITELPGSPEPNPDPTAPAPSETDIGIFDGMNYIMHMFKNIPAVLTAAVYYLLTFTFCAVVGFLLVSSQMIGMVLMTIGPIMLLFLYFEQTKQYFVNWFNQVVGIVVYQALLLIFLSLFVTGISEFVLKFADAIARLNNGDYLNTMAGSMVNDTMLSMGGIAGVIFYTLIGILLSLQIKPLAAAISNGLHLPSAIGKAANIAIQMKQMRLNGSGSTTSTGGSINKR